MSSITLGKFADTFIPVEVHSDYTNTTTYISGAPNSGKSTLLGNLAEQFHASGEGVLVLDIKGDLARDIASRTERPDDCIYVKLGEIDFGHRNYRYWTINPFEGHLESRQRRGQIRQAVVQSFERMGLAQLDTMANIRHTMEIATDLALNLPDPTYVDLYAFVVDKEYRERVVRSSPNLNPFTAREWIDLGKSDNKTMTPREQRGITRTSRNRLYTLLGDETAYLTACMYKSTLKLRQWLDAGKMVVIDVGQPLERQTGIDLGNMVMAQLLSSIFQRPLNQRERTWRIVVDEFHNFVGNSFAEIITDARSYNVFLVVAHHDRGQLAKPELAPLRSAIGFAGIEARFSQSREDRVALASMYGIDVVGDYFDLRQFEARVSYFSRLLGNKTTETIVLNDWWRDPVDGQLEMIEKRSIGLTKHRNTLTERFTSRYLPLLDANANRDSVDSNGNKQSSRNNQKGTGKVKVLTEQDQNTQAGQLSGEETKRTPRPGRRGPARALDQLDDSGSLLPRPPAKD